MSRRWVCPACGSGVLAPDRPRRDDVRRYCLDCSAETGRLVERSCPALDRAREASRERAAYRAATKTQRAADARRAAHTLDGFDLLAEARRLWRLPGMKAAPRGNRPLPTISFRFSRTKTHSSGHCKTTTPGRDIVVTCGTNLADARCVLLHELVHAAERPHEWHGPRFKARERLVFREAGYDVAWVRS